MRDDGTIGAMGWRDSIGRLISSQYLMCISKGCYRQAAQTGCPKTVEKSPLLGSKAGNMKSRSLMAATREGTFPPHPCFLWSQRGLVVSVLLRSLPPPHPHSPACPEDSRHSGSKAQPTEVHIQPTPSAMILCPRGSQSEFQGMTCEFKEDAT